MERTGQAVGGAALELVQGDITIEQVDAIVNAANSSLMGGGGVDGAIHRAGGPEILEGCRAVVARQGSLSTGQAVATTAGRLPARWVIHTVGPVWRGGEHDEPALLRSCYARSLAVAREVGARTVAFPSISTGIFGYPIDLAAPVALGAVRELLAAQQKSAEQTKLGTIERVRFVLFDAATFAAYQSALEQTG